MFTYLSPVFRLTCAGLLAGGLLAAEGDPLTLKARPYSLNIEDNVRYNDDGSIGSFSGNSYIGLKIALPDDLELSGYQGFKLESMVVVTEAKKEIKVGARTTSSSSPRIERFNDYTRRDRQFSLSLPIETPPFNAVRIKELVGSVTLIAPASKDRILPMAKAGDWLGKRLAVKDVDEGRITLKSIKGREVTIRMSRSCKDLMKELSFTDASGKVLRHRYSGYSGGSSGYDMRYQVDGFDAKGSLTLTFYGETKKVAARFTVTNVPMREAGGAPEGITVIELQEKPEPKKEAKPDKPTLEVEVEADPPKKPAPKGTDGF